MREQVNDEVNDIVGCWNVIFEKILITKFLKMFSSPISKFVLAITCLDLCRGFHLYSRVNSLILIGLDADPWMEKTVRSLLTRVADPFGSLLLFITLVVEETFPSPPVSGPDRQNQTRCYTTTSHSFCIHT